MQPHILLIVKDRKDQARLRCNLEAEGYSVLALADATGLRNILTEFPANLALIDADAPSIGEIATIRQIKEECGNTGIVVMGRPPDDIWRHIHPLHLADDYISKPYSLRHLQTRIRLLLRKQIKPRRAYSFGWHDRQKKTALFFAGWTLDTASRTLRDGHGHTVALTPIEFGLLEIFVTRQGQILDRTLLCSALPRHTESGIDRSIDVAVMRLRRKLGEQQTAPALIKTVRGGGYVFTATVTPADRETTAEQTSL